MGFNISLWTWKVGEKISYVSEIIVNQCFFFDNMCSLLKKKYSSYFYLKRYQLHLIVKH